MNNSTTSRSSRGTPIYRIEPESSDFDITPITGDIFPSGTLKNGRHEFHVVAKDALGQEGKAKIVITLGSQMGSNYGFKAKRRGRNVKRDRATDIVIALKEDHPLGLLSTQVALFSDEIIDLAPIDSDYLKIHENGSVELTRELNFETENEIKVNVPISGPFNSEFIFQILSLRIFCTRMFMDFKIGCFSSSSRNLEIKELKLNYLFL